VKTWKDPLAFRLGKSLRLARDLPDYQNMACLLYSICWDEHFAIPSDQIFYNQKQAGRLYW
jgi:hypothetical protein